MKGARCVATLKQCFSEPQTADVLERVIDPHATAALVLRAREGDTEAFAALAAAFLRASYLTALAIVARPNDAEDVAQDAFVVALERIDSCREPERFARWLLQIVRNRALNCLERRRLRDVPRNESSVDVALEPPSIGIGQLRARLLHALLHVSEIQREVVLLHDVEEWTHLEIAAALGISVGMSRQHLFNARRVLRGRLAEHAEAEVRHARR